MCGGGGTPPCHSARGAHTSAGIDTEAAASLPPLVKSRQVKSAFDLTRLAASLSRMHGGRGTGRDGGGPQRRTAAGGVYQSPSQATTCSGLCVGGW